MIEKLFVGLLRLARSLANLFGYELAVKLTEHEIILGFRDPDNTEKHAWDPSAFVKGNVFLEDAANPITVDPDRDTLISSERYQEYMENTLVSDILHSDREGLRLVHVLIILAGLQLISIGAVAGLWLS